jgi:hypothetical protein
VIDDAIGRMKAKEEKVEGLIELKSKFAAS